MIKELTFPTRGLTPSLSRVSWGAIWASAIFTTALVVVFLVLGFSIGLAVAPTTTPASLAFAAGLWWFLTGEVSFFLGGWMAGRLTPIASFSESVIHALVSWGMSTLALTYLVLGIGAGLLGNAGGIMGGAFGTAARGAQIVGGVGVFAFLVSLSEMFAAAVGARTGTRLLVATRPLPQPERQVETARV